MLDDLNFYSSLDFHEDDFELTFLINKRAASKNLLIYNCIFTLKNTRSGINRVLEIPFVELIEYLIHDSFLSFKNKLNYHRLSIPFSKENNCKLRNCFEIFRDYYYRYLLYLFLNNNSNESLTTKTQKIELFKFNKEQLLKVKTLLNNYNFENLANDLYFSEFDFILSEKNDFVTVYAKPDFSIKPSSNFNLEEFQKDIISVVKNKYDNLNLIETNLENYYSRKIVFNNLKESIKDTFSYEMLTLNFLLGS